MQIFISYSRGDKLFVETLTAGIKGLGYKVWIDTKDILPSTEWLQMILDAIDQSSVFLIIISEKSIASEMCLKEIKQAADLGKKIIPLVIGDASKIAMPETLKKIQWVTWNKGDSFSDNLNLLNSAIKADLDWHILHTTLLMQSRFWKKNDETKDILLRGNMLLNAETWIDDSIRDKNKLITHDQQQFILKSRKTIARQNLLPILNGLALMILMAFILSQMGAVLKTIVSPAGILNLELAAKPQEANFILSSWHSNGLISTAYTLVQADFIFIYTYLLFFIYSLKYFTQYFKRRKKLLSRIASFLFYMVVLVACCDVLENFFLMMILNGQHIPIFRFISILSIVKFAVSFACSFYLIFSLTYSILLKRRIEAIETID